MNRGPLALIILDGWGLRDEREGNAVALAPTPHFDRLWRQWPRTQLFAHGRHVGLPDGQIGNSEVGHLNLGAGRIVYQDIVRIDQAIADGSLAQSPVLERALKQLAPGGRVHLLGLFSDGGVHSHIEHILALRALIAAAGRPVRLHCFLDGRDVPPKSAARYFDRLEQAGGLADVATVMGRFYAMDRDRRWERTQAAYEALVLGRGRLATGAREALAEAYRRGESDEFVAPTVIVDNGLPRGLVAAGDLVIFCNFRADRARQLTRALSDPEFSAFPRRLCLAPEALLTMVPYDETLPNPALLPPHTIERPLGEVVAAAGLTQLRIAETEKYAHVTYFFNGGREEPFAGESRILVPSPRVATYDATPAMSAREVTDRLLEELDRGAHDLIVLNYANPDMVGHTGDLNAAITACAVVDECLGRVLSALERVNGRAIVCADHGNAELMINPEDGGPHTAHTTNPVPFILVDPEHRQARLRSGVLADVAPTILALLGLEVPPEMDRTSLLEPGPITEKGGC
ncbi:MAG TPA: 2,3-bisphosphoglycerate-independent phosphoglycerate mutase [Bacillota bacterium]